MKHLLIALTILLSLTISAPSIAEEHDHHHEHGHVEHYEGKHFTSYSDALKSLKGDIQKIDLILGADKLTSSQLEEVHEISYGLEDAIEVIAEKQTRNAEIIKVMAVTIENIHNTSEDHEETELRKQFSDLQEQASKL